MQHGHLVIDLPDGSSATFGRDGAEPRARIQILDERFFRRCLWYGDIGFAESYLAGEWQTDDLTAVFRWFLANVSQAPTLSGSQRRYSLLNVLGQLNRWRHRLRPNSVRTSRRNIQEHYDLSNEFFATFLDETFTYSSAIWTDPAQSLREAQFEKYERLCRQLRLHEGDHVLEIGCGWGGFAMHAASRYRCRVTAITISPAQFEFATRRIRAAGLADRVEVWLQDYRRVQGRFSKIVSIEMLEAVGHRYHPDFASTCARLLAPGGLLALQFITCPATRYDSLRRGVDFIQKHIFPGSLLLSLNRVNDLLGAAGSLGLHDLRDLGTDYARTLREWHARFLARLPEVRALGFDETFVRKWSYYLCYCEAAFATRNISVVQALYSRPNNAELDRTPAPTGGGLP
jgi:cyclopropane-fatty-acyl-phospholipid synthase